jgi:hypothetical protein
MNTIAVLSNHQGGVVEIGYNFALSVAELVEVERIDCFIVGSEDGFSPLGLGLHYFARDLGYEEQEIKDLADWNRFENPEVSVLVLPSRREGSKLKGLILAASETSKCYEKFAVPLYGKPYRNFYYGVTYEAISAAAEYLGATAIAMTHLSASGKFHEDIAKCNVEALAHCVASSSGSKLVKFLFGLCCIQSEHLQDIGSIIEEARNTQHSLISKTLSARKGCTVISVGL